MLDFQLKIHYNLNMTVHMMQVLLAGCMVSMVLLAAFFLRSRKLSLLEYAIWGGIAILLPAVGPFLVIWLRPGQKPAAN